MNDQLTTYARDTLKEDLAKCTSEQVHLFKRMYSFKDLEKDINKVVDDMPDEKLDWAMQQVSRTLEKNQKGE